MRGAGVVEVAESDSASGESSLGNGEGENGSAARDRFLHPNTASVLLHDSLTYGEANSTSRVFTPVMQARKEAENLVRVILTETDPVVGHGKDQPALLADDGHMDSRRLLTSIF